MSTEALPSAAVTLEEIVAKDPTTALYLPVAERMLARGLVSDAIRLCEERRGRPGQGVGDHIVLGRCYLADGRLAQARAEFERALELDRENVVALKSLAGILSHEGRHAEASDLYRAVCRVDAGDLESQSALHQITSGEYPEVRPPEVIVSQGDLSWQPIRLTREEDHLSELALGLPTFDSLEAGTLRPTSPLAGIPRESLVGADELSLGPDFPRERIVEERAPEAAPAPPPAPAAPSRHEIVVATEGFPAGGLHNRLGSLDVEEFQTSALERLDEALRPAAVRALGEVPPPEPEPEAQTVAPVELPASALIDEGAGTTKSASGRSAVWDDEAPASASAPGAPAAATLAAATPAQAPEAQAVAKEPQAGAEEAPPPTVAGNRAAFETWLRRLGGRS